VNFKTAKKKLTRLPKVWM